MRSKRVLLIRLLLRYQYLVFFRGKLFPVAWFGEVGIDVLRRKKQIKEF